MLDCHVCLHFTGFIYRKEKHQVLDLRHVGHDFWRIQTRTEEGNCSAETVDGEQVVKVLPIQALRRLLKVIADLCLRPHLEEEQACFLQWAQQRKGFLQLCYMKMKICALPVCSMKKTLNVFQPWHTEELELNWGWDYFHTAPCFGQMRSLHKLSLTHLQENLGNWQQDSRHRREMCQPVQSQFSNFNCL